MVQILHPPVLLYCLRKPPRVMYILYKDRRKDADAKNEDADCQKGVLLEGKVHRQLERCIIRWKGTQKGIYCRCSARRKGTQIDVNSSINRQADRQVHKESERPTERQIYSTIMKGIQKTMVFFCCHQLVKLGIVRGIRLHDTYALRWSVCYNQTDAEALFLDVSTVCYDPQAGV